MQNTFSFFRLMRKNKGLVKGECITTNVGFIERMEDGEDISYNFNEINYWVQMAMPIWHAKLRPIKKADLYNFIKQHHPQ